MSYSCLFVMLLLASHVTAQAGHYDDVVIDERGIMLPRYANLNELVNEGKNRISDDSTAALSILLPAEADLGGDSNIVWLNDTCPFKEKSFGELMDDAKKQDSAWLVAAYQCASKDPVIANKIRHADAIELFRHFHTDSKKLDPISKLPITKARYYACRYNVYECLGDLLNARK